MSGCLYTLREVFVARFDGKVSSKTSTKKRVKQGFHAFFVVIQLMMPHIYYLLGKEPKSLKSFIMKNIQDLIDEKGVLNIPEKIVIKNAPIENGISYVPSIIGKSAFDHMNNLTELHIPKTITEIEWCFYECYHLKNIFVADENPNYYDIDGVLYSKKEGKVSLIAYPNAHGEEYTIPEGVEEIAHFAFKSCKDIKTIPLPKLLKTINCNAFYQCTSLKSIELPDGIKHIGDTVGDSKVDIDYIYKGKSYTLEGIQALVNSKK